MELIYTDDIYGFENNLSLYETDSIWLLDGITTSLIESKEDLFMCFSDEIIESKITNGTFAINNGGKLTKVLYKHDYVRILEELTKFEVLKKFQYLDYLNSNKKKLCYSRIFQKDLGELLYRYRTYDSLKVHGEEDNYKYYHCKWLEIFKNQQRFYVTLRALKHYQKTDITQDIPSDSEFITETEENELINFRLSKKIKP